MCIRYSQNIHIRQFNIQYSMIANPQNPYDKIRYLELLMELFLKNKSLGKISDKSMELFGKGRKEDTDIWGLVEEIFNTFDANNSGHLDQNEFRELLDFGRSKGFIQRTYRNEFVEYMKKMDKNKDGLISKEEFFSFIKQSIAIFSEKTFVYDRPNFDTEEVQAIVFDPLKRSYVKGGTKELSSSNVILPPPKIRSVQQQPQRAQTQHWPNEAERREVKVKFVGNQQKVNSYPKIQLADSAQNMDEKVNEIYQKYDRNRSGQLDSIELQGFLQVELHSKYTRMEFMRLADTDKSGLIGKQKMKAFLQREYQT